MELKDISHYPSLENRQAKHEIKYYRQYLGNRFEHNPRYKHVFHQLRQRNIGLALELLADLLAKDIENEEIYRLQGEIYVFYSEFLAAWERYDQILKKDSKDKEALFLTAFFAHYLGDEEFYERRNRLSFLSTHLLNELDWLIHFIEANNRRTDFQFDIPANTSFDLLTVYGSRINEDGTLTKELLERLELILEYAHLYPDAEILVAGGPVNNIHHEALAMHNWLVDKGIDTKRISTEMTALDMVIDSIAVTEMIATKHYNQILILSTPNFLPRSWLSLSAQCRMANLDVNIYGVSSQEPNSITVDELEVRKSYQTTLRSAGVFEPHYFDK